MIASSTGGIREWLEPGVNGLLVDPGDAQGLAEALNELLDDPERGRSMGAAGRRIVEERFSRGRHLDALLEAYAAAGSNRKADAGEQPPETSGAIV